MFTAGALLIAVFFYTMIVAIAVFVGVEFYFWWKLQRKP